MQQSLPHTVPCMHLQRLCFYTEALPDENSVLTVSRLMSAKDVYWPSARLLPAATDALVRVNVSKTCVLTVSPLTPAAADALHGQGQCQQKMHTHHQPAYSSRCWRTGQGQCQQKMYTDHQPAYSSRCWRTGQGQCQQKTARDKWAALSDSGWRGSEMERGLPIIRSEDFGLKSFDTSKRNKFLLKILLHKSKGKLKNEYKKTRHFSLDSIILTFIMPTFILNTYLQQLLAMNYNYGYSHHFETKIVFNSRN